MKWESFLNHPEVVNTTLYRFTSVGQYLFGKVLHDVLECLNMYEACGSLALTLSNVPDDTLKWFSRWSPLVRTWISNLSPLWEQETKPSSVEPNWAHLIAMIGKIPKEASVMAFESQTLTLPKDDKSTFIVKAMIYNILRLNLICKDIQNQEYLRLWKTNYKDSQKRENTTK